MQEKILCEDNYKPQSFGDHLGWVGEFEHKGRRLIVSYKADRARHDARQREQVIGKIKKRLGEDGDAQKLITNAGVKKFTGSDPSKAALSQEKIAKDALWDGIHGIITNIKPKQTKEEEAAQAKENKESQEGQEEKVERADAIELIMRYSRLWKIEESFRLNKHTLSMRPIYHFKPERIRAHIGLCYMAFSVLRHMEYRVRLTQKISPEVMIEELLNVQASLYRHTPTGRLYRMPGKFTNHASRIYKAFQIERKNHAQEIVQL